MERITPTDPESQSKDLVAENIEKLKQLFPDIVADGKVNIEVLQELLGEEVEDERQRYQFTWPGKANARREAQKPSRGTLRPAKEESVDWDNTENLFIEGDNLEVLKILQKSYHNKVKMIYIDPPYNTGKEFVYRDDYRDNLANFLKVTKQKSEKGESLSTNTESEGRYHSNWLNMMYPRLKLARNVLREDGVIFISIDDHEYENLKKICVEIFGESNFVATIIWKKRSTPPNDKIIGTNHDYILVFAKSIDNINLNLRERSAEQSKRFKNPDNHPKGPWIPGDLMANVKGGRYVESLYFPIKNLKTGQIHYPSSEGNWRFSKETIDKLIENDEIYFGKDGRGRPKLKRFLKDIKDGVTYPTIWDFVPLNTHGSYEMTEILGNLAVFDNPKPHGLLKEIIKLGSSDDDIVLDFFAGSSTTAHATIEVNKESEGQRKYIMVQLPEATEEKSQARKLGFQTIAKIGAERIRRVINTNDENYSGSKNLDLGFKVFKLDTSNIRAWDPDYDNLEQSLWDQVYNIKEERSEEDVLYEILVKYGLDLTVPIEEHEIEGETVYSVGKGALLVCLSENITSDIAEGIGKLKDELQPETCRVLFRDNGFPDDKVKTNVSQNLKQQGIEEVRSI